LNFKIHEGRERQPLCSGGQSSWLQIQRSGFDSRHYQIFWQVAGLEWELLERESRGSGLENRDYGRRDPLCWPWDTPLSAEVGTLPTSSGCLVGIVRSQTTATELLLLLGPLNKLWQHHQWHVSVNSWSGQTQSTRSTRSCACTTTALLESQQLFWQLEQDKETVLLQSAVWNAFHTGTNLYKDSYHCHVEIMLLYCSTFVQAFRNNTAYKKEKHHTRCSVQVSAGDYTNSCRHEMV
jgi:hypothetical protein